MRKIVQIFVAFSEKLSFNYVTNFELSLLMDFFTLELSLFIHYYYLLNDGAKRNRLPYLKIMYTGIRKILHLHKILYI
jgi:hypothetical protein